MGAGVAWVGLTLFGQVVSSVIMAGWSSWRGFAVVGFSLSKLIERVREKRAEARSGRGRALTRPPLRARAPPQASGPGAPPRRPRRLRLRLATALPHSATSPSTTSSPATRPRCSAHGFDESQYGPRPTPTRRPSSRAPPDDWPSQQPAHGPARPRPGASPATTCPTSRRGSPSAAARAPLRPQACRTPRCATKAQALPPRRSRNRWRRGPKPWPASGPRSRRTATCCRPCRLLASANVAAVPRARPRDDELAGDRGTASRRRWRTSASWPRWWAGSLAPR